MKAIIISPFDPIPCDDTVLIRYGRLAEELADSGHEVTYITSSFFHLNKTSRTTKEWSKDYDENRIKLIQINTLHYQKNSSFARIINHFQFAFRLKNLLKKLLKNNQHDIIISAFPPILSNYFVSTTALRFSIPYIIDIQDLWPEAFQLFFKNRRLTKALCFPLFILRNNIIKNSTSLNAVSETYIEFLSHIRKGIQSRSFPLGIDINKFQKAINTSWKEVPKTINERWVTYIGSSKSIAELNTLFEVAKRCPEFVFFILGKGYYLEKLKSLIKVYDLKNVRLIWVQSFEYQANILARSDVGLLIVDPNCYSFLPNKTFYYLSAGLAIVSNIQSKEIAALTEIQGFNPIYNSGNHYQLKEKIISGSEISNEKKEEIKKFAAMNYDSKNIYINYRLWLEKIIHKK